MVYEFNRAPMSESTFHSDRQGVRDLMTQGGKGSSDPPQSWRIKMLKNYKDLKGGVYRHHILIVHIKLSLDNNNVCFTTKQKRRPLK